MIFRSLRYPQVPDPAAPDYHEQCRRYWRESEVWWDNWAVNFTRSLLIVLAAVVAVAAGILIATITGSA